MFMDNTLSFVPYVVLKFTSIVPFVVVFFVIVFLRIALRTLRVYSFRDYVGFQREYWGNMFFPLLYCLIFIVSVWFFMLLDNLLSPDFSAVEEVEEVESVGEKFISDY